MSARITINFAGGTATANAVEVSLSNCSVSLGLNYGASVAMASALTNITVLSGQVSVATANNAQFNGTLVLPIGWTTGEQPSVTLYNLQNPSGSSATVTWPTATGPQTQILTPGDPMPLTDVVDN